MTRTYAVTENRLAVTVGDVLKGFGLHNAGRYYTVRALSRTTGRVQLEEHLTGRVFWTFCRYYRQED